MANEDLFGEEGQMVRMTFGEHLEELRRRIVFALIGFALAIPIGLLVGEPLMHFMVKPVHDELRAYDENKKKEVSQKYFDARGKQQRGESLDVKERELVNRQELRLVISRQVLRDMVRQAVPELAIPEDSPIEGAANDASNSDQATQTSDAPPDAVGPKPPADLIGPFPVWVDHGALLIATWSDLLRNLGLQSLGTLEVFIAWMKVSLLAGLVIASPWVIFHLWSFVAEGLYRHERRVVYRAMPFSIGLFGAGVLFCFFVVLPVVVRFSFTFNRWLDIPPNIRVSEWLGFATLLPVIFGACFELPLVMLVLEMVGIFRIDDYMSKWRHAVLGISVLSMVVTPTTDPGSMMLLVTPMTGLYFLGIGMVWLRLAKQGKVEPLTRAGKLRIAAGTIAGMYAAALGLLFVLPPAWLPENWFDDVWHVATLPTSYLIGLGRELTRSATGWIWFVTLGNATLLGLVVYRIGEVVLRVAGRPAK